MDTATPIRPVPDSPATPGSAADLARAAGAPLTLSDRCDRCGSRAYLRATLTTGGALLFCGHHGGRHRAALLGLGAVLHDETDRITVDRESSAAA